MSAHATSVPCKEEKYLKECGSASHTEGNINIEDIFFGLVEIYLTLKNYFMTEDSIVQ